MLRLPNSAPDRHGSNGRKSESENLLHEPSSLFLVVGPACHCCGRVWSDSDATRPACSGPCALAGSRPHPRAGVTPARSPRSWTVDQLLAGGARRSRRSRRFWLPVTFSGHARRLALFRASPGPGRAGGATSVLSRLHDPRLNASPIRRIARR